MADIITKCYNTFPLSFYFLFVPLRCHHALIWAFKIRNKHRIESLRSIQEKTREYRIIDKTLIEDSVKNLLEIITMVWSCKMNGFNKNTKTESELIFKGKRLIVQFRTMVQPYSGRHLEKGKELARKWKERQ